MWDGEVCCMILMCHEHTNPYGRETEWVPIFLIQCIMNPTSYLLRVSQSKYGDFHFTTTPSPSEGGVSRDDLECVRVWCHISGTLPKGHSTLPFTSTTPDLSL